MDTLGKVFLVGAGPGAVDLLTLRAARLLAQADVVLHDALVSEEVLAVATRARRINVGKRCGRRSMPQAAINLLLVDAAITHRTVVRLKGGDPAVFGRLREELDALQRAGIAHEVVPGITSALAAAAQLGVSLTERGLARSVTLATPAVGVGEAGGSDWACADPSATLCLYMSGGDFGACARRLIARGWSPQTPVRAVRNISGLDSQVWSGTLDQVPSRIAGPVTVLIGWALAGAAPLALPAAHAITTAPTLS